VEEVQCVNTHISSVYGPMGKSIMCGCHGVIGQYHLSSSWKEPSVEISFVIPGPPVAKARVKTVPLRKCLRCGKTGMGFPCRYCGGVSSEFVTNIPYTPKQTTNYESLVRLCASEAMKVMGIEKLSGAISVRVNFYFPIAPSRAKKLKDGDWHTQRPDVDNCKKSILDGCNEIVWHDDCIVAEIYATKRWGVNPRAEVEVKEIVTGEVLYGCIHSYCS
jgi:Holliday junction resolvase RusA-like endonuclease